jgi:hypothetical protein
MPLEGGAVLQVTLKDMARRMKSGSVSAGLYDPENATKGYINEYGDPAHNIPPRPFMRITFATFREMWVEELKNHFKQHENTADALKATGLMMATHINNVLQTARGRFAPNAPRTVRQKGFNFPLLETGAMFKAVSYRVEKVRL